MGNERLIKSMLSCDGSNKNCEECTFKDMPECRNAMAHHAGALIQLQDVVIANAAAQAGGLHMQLAASKQEYQEALEVVQKQRKRVGEILHGLHELRHCESCAYSTPQTDEEAEKIREALCKQCVEACSEWELSAAFGVEEAGEDAGEDGNGILKPMEE